MGFVSDDIYSATVELDAGATSETAVEYLQVTIEEVSHVLRGIFTRYPTSSCDVQAQLGFTPNLAICLAHDRGVCTAVDNIVMTKFGLY